MYRFAQIRSILILLILAVQFAACSGSPPAARLPFPFKTAAESVGANTSTENSSMPSVQLPTQRVRAPEFPRDFAWVNTDRPLYFNEALKGRIVVLDFWTYCCINCMHILPDLEYIEHKYANEPVVVIGVHSAKFDNEGDKQNINTACQRYNIAHPVIVDEGHRIWSEYTVQAWPTLVVVDAEGRVVGQLSGEGNREILDGAIQALLDEGRAKGVLAAGSPEFKRDSRVPASSGLSFPGKVLAHGDRVFIADSNHDRMVIADTSGKVITIVGSGTKGTSDGAFEQAQFDNPQGMAFDSKRNLLYVADTDNHLIRKLDLQARTVSTISGTGEQVYDRMGGGIGTSQGLNSPWDVVLLDQTLYIAMAGPHQIWTLDLPTGVARAWAGSGREDIIDGTGIRSAALAQPSGLALDGEWLYFADSEVSAVRRVNLKTTQVETLVGSGLFNFGDQTGGLKSTSLQHPLGVAIHNSDVLVADTYNHKIKRLAVSAKQSADFIGSGNPELTSESASAMSLYEPGGLSVSEGILYIADTNHDRILRANLTDGSWSVFELTGLRAMESASMEHDATVEVTVPYEKGKELTLSLNATLPRGVHLNKQAPISYVVKADGAAPLEGLATSAELPVRVQIPGNTIAGNAIEAMLAFAYCTDEHEGLCVPVSVNWRIKLEDDANSNNQSELTAEVKRLPQ